MTINAAEGKYSLQTLLVTPHRVEMMTSEMTTGAGPHKKFPVNAFRPALVAFSLP